MLVTGYDAKGRDADHRARQRGDGGHPASGRRSTGRLDRRPGLRLDFMPAASLYVDDRYKPMCLHVSLGQHQRHRTSRMAFCEDGLKRRSVDPLYPRGGWSRGWLAPTSAATGSGRPVLALQPSR